MAFRESEGSSGIVPANEQMGLNTFLQKGFGSPPRMATGEFDLLSPAQNKLLNDILLPMIGQRAGNFDQITSLSALEQQALNFGQEQGQAVFGAGGVAEQGRGAFSEAIGNVGANFEQFYQQNIRDVVLEDFTENIRPTTSRKFADSGFFGSERARADELDVENLMKTLTRGRSETQLAANQQLGTLSSQAGTFEAQLSGLIGQLMAQGGVQREIQGSEFDRLMASMLSALGINTIENVAIGLPGEQGGIKETGQSFMGGLGSGLGGCWVAEELYGPYADKTYRIRALIHLNIVKDSALGRFARMYIRYGKVWAALASNNTHFRVWATYLWDSLYKLAQADRRI